jgi:single-stranded-DNA-specific exonuclease
MPSQKIIKQREILNDCNHLKVHPLLQRIYAARGVGSDLDIDYRLENLLSYESLLGINQAIELLYEALVKQQTIVVVGDFDTDGATSTALAVKVLKALGLQNVYYLVPNRFVYGYGLSPEIVKVALQYKPDLIITVDNGIASHEGVEAAHALGIKVLITDHHIPSATVPNADAIVNPNQANDKFGSKNLAGVGVIFYVFLALRNFLRDKDFFANSKIPMPNMAQFLDLVALGTIADVVFLDKNNRILVHQGIQRIRSGKCCSGIKMLLEIANTQLKSVTATDLAYSVAPKLNAAGRLDDISIGIECLLADNDKKAQKIASTLNLLNKERKAIEVGMHQQAQDAIALLQQYEELPVGICLLNKSWHQGIVGIIASRIKDACNRPTIAFTEVGEDEIKGSARSINGLHMRDILEAVAKKNPGLLTKFGGHAMAAGLTLPRAKYDEFCELFNQEILQQADPQSFQEIVYIDGELEAGLINIQTAELLQNSTPWGHGFAEPLFGGSFKIVQKNLVGSRHLKMVLNNPNTTQMVDAIMFNHGEELISNSDSAYIVYSLGVNEYRGNRNLQLIVRHVEWNY